MVFKFIMNQCFKIVIAGSSGVGKSAIIQRLVHGTFNEDSTITCGADFYTYTCPVNSDNVKLQIWDTAGQERFRSISKSYFRNAVGAILVYDMTSMETFDQLTDWLNDLQNLCSPNACILLVGNKADLESERKVGEQQVKDFADRHHLETLETSAKSGKNIQEAFVRLAYEVIAGISQGRIQFGINTNRAIQPLFINEDNKGDDSKHCC